MTWLWQGHWRWWEGPLGVAPGLLVAISSLEIHDDSEEEEAQKERSLEPGNLVTTSLRWQVNYGPLVAVCFPSWTVNYDSTPCVHPHLAPAPSQEPSTVSPININGLCSSTTA